MKRPALRFAKSADGGTVAFSATGSGHPFVMFTGPTNGVLEWEMPNWAPFLERVSEHLTVVLVAVRGNTNADPAPADRKLSDYALDDIMAVVDTLGFAHYAAAAVGTWAEQLAALAVRDSSRVSHLVFQLPRTTPLETNWSEGVKAHEYVAAAYGRDSASLRALELLGPSATAEQLEGVVRFIRANHGCPHFHAFREKMDERNREIDLGPYLPQISQPTLVYADQRALAEGVELAASIRGARLLQGRKLPSALTDPFESRAAADEIIEFICGVRPRESRDQLSRLSSREREVLAAVAAGRTNAEIAIGMNLSVATVARHVANVYAKLDVRNRTEATRKFLSEAPPEPAQR